MASHPHKSVILTSLPRQSYTQNFAMGLKPTCINTIYFSVVTLQFVCRTFNNNVSRNEVKCSTGMPYVKFSYLLSNQRLLQIPLTASVMYIPRGSYVYIRDGQCTYNVTFRCVRVTIVVVEKQKVLHIVSVCL